MFMDSIISDSNSIFKFLKQLDLDLFLSKPQFNHLNQFLNVMIQENYQGKISAVKHCHRTTFGRFLNDSPWDDGAISNQIQAYLLSCLYNRSHQTGKPIYVLVDDTTCVKTKPSSQATYPIQGCDWHYSHLHHQSVYGHQFVTVMLQCDDVILPYQIIPYEKDKQSKIELVKEILTTLPKPPHKGYILADSWYSCEALFQIANQLGFYYLGGIKTNRIILPKGYRPKGIQLKQFANTLSLKDLDLVTVGSERYYTYLYQGRIRGGHVVQIILSWPHTAPLEEKALRCFVSHDLKMSAKQLLKHYTKRWPIEIFFREVKQNFGMGQYQIRALKGIKRLMLMIQFVYLYLKRMTPNNSCLGESIRQCQRKQKQELVKIIYRKAQNGVALKTIFEELKIA